MSAPLTAPSGLVSRRLDALIILSISATSWARGARPAGARAEIVEISACAVRMDSLQVGPTQTWLIRPLTAPVSDVGAARLERSASELQQGTTLPAACEGLERTLLSEHLPWASYGDYDRRMLTRACQRADRRFPMGPTHLNLKHLFALLTGAPTERPLDQALTRLGLDPVSGCSAAARARDAARLVSALLKPIRTLLEAP